MESFKNGGYKRNLKNKTAGIWVPDMVSERQDRLKYIEDYFVNKRRKL